MLDKVYIAKIGLGILAVFGVGMVAKSGIEAGKAKVTTIAHSDAPITIPMFGIPFRSPRGEIGSIQSLRIDRSAPKMIDGFDLAVTLNEGVDASQFADCEITLTNPENIDENTSFSCLTEADAAYDNLVQFGHITFAPSGQVHRLMVPESVRDKIRNEGSAAAGDMMGDSSASSDGNLSIKINGTSLLEIHGDSAGGTVMVRDPKTGKTIVDIQGTNTGTSVKVDSN